jgi:hypothetical protein
MSYLCPLKDRLPLRKTEQEYLGLKRVLVEPPAEASYFHLAQELLHRSLSQAHQLVWEALYEVLEDLLQR